MTTINTQQKSILKNKLINQDTDPSIAFKMLRLFLGKSILIGNFRVVDVYGGIHDFGDKKGKRVCIKFQTPSAYRKLLLNPDLYFGEGYMNGEITLEEGTISQLMEVILMNIPTQGGFVKPTSVVLDALDLGTKHFRQINTPKIAQENVSHHYDLSSDFYKLFLDQEWQYSCGYFAKGDESLEEAQKKKMEHITKKLLINSDHSVLDIGCGWGGLARHIARETGAKVTGITLSKEQLLFAQKRTREEGLEDRVDFKLCDYRHLDDKFDRIVSVGMFEHVGINFYETFFKTIRKLMKGEGVGLLHSIGRSTKPTSINPWIQKYIFPGGYIPSLSEVIPHVEKSGLLLTDLEVLRLHYAKTLHEWRKRFEKHRNQVKHIYDERFCRMWEFYLASSEASFKYSGNMVFHMQFAVEQDAVPLTRNYLCP